MHQIPGGLDAVPGGDSKEEASFPEDLAVDNNGIETVAAQEIFFIDRVFKFLAAIQAQLGKNRVQKQFFKLR
jgi:hypothetical protein